MQFAGVGCVWFVKPGFPTQWPAEFLELKRACLGSVPATHRHASTATLATSLVKSNPQFAHAAVPFSALYVPGKHAVQFPPPTLGSPENPRSHRHAARVALPRGATLPVGHAEHGAAPVSGLNVSRAQASHVS